MPTNASGPPCIDIVSTITTCCKGPTSCANIQKTHLHNQRSLGKSQIVRRRLGQPTDDIAHRQSPVGQFVRQFRYSQRPIQPHRSPGVLFLPSVSTIEHLRSVVMPSHRRIARAGHHGIRQPVIEIILIFANNMRLFPDLRFVLFDPQTFR